MDDILRQLSAPFDPRSVRWRAGSTNKKKWEAAKRPPDFNRRGLPLAYIDARDVMDRLDEVCGHLWECDTKAMPNGSYCASIGIEIDGRTRWRSNGAGGTDIETEKGGYSDAIKRAAVMWGIGRYLYAVKAPWVRLDEHWQIPPQEMAKLQNLLGQRYGSDREAAVAIGD
jgi:hypothetical protein